MANKLTRLTRAFWSESIKRLPYVLGLLVILLLVSGVQSYRKIVEGVQIAKENTVVIKQQGQDIKTLTQQNKDLTNQNNRLAKENAAHIDCIARYFSQFTTAQLTDLDKCIITPYNTTGVSDTTSPTNGGQITTKSQTTPSSPGGSSNSAPTQAKANSAPTPKNCTLDLLGVHLLCNQEKQK